MRYLGKEKRRIIVNIPEEISEHTCKAIGSKNPIKRAKNNAKKLRKFFRRAFEKLSKSNELVGEFYLLDWKKDVFPNSAYIASLEVFMKLFQGHAMFRYDASRTTAMVLGREYALQSEETFSESILAKLNNDDGVQEGVHYLIKELAFYTASKDIFKVDSIAKVYYKRWRIYEKYLKGEYDGVPKEGLGCLVIGYKESE